MKTFNHNSGQYLEVCGAKIYYEEIGKKEKPVLLILHGGLHDMENLNSVASYLSDDFRIIGIDSRGHGKSTLGDMKLTYAQMQLDTEAILKHLGIDTIHIFGMSDGGIIAYRIAASNNVKVNKLITMGASWRVKDVIEAEEIIKTITPESAKELFPENVKRYQRINPEPNYEKFVHTVVDMWLDKSNTGHPDQSVKDISAETLLIRGDKDFLVSLESLVELRDIIKNSAFLNVPFAEHGVYEEQPQVIEIMLTHFLNVYKGT
jgi:pimeloyl-ACP methyl ester carboxylesterase